MGFDKKIRISLESLAMDVKSNLASTGCERALFFIDGSSSEDVLMVGNYFRKKNIPHAFGLDGGYIGNNGKGSDGKYYPVYLRDLEIHESTMP